MLQINTGKLFSEGVGRRNALTGVLHTNARFGWNTRLETLAGTLRSVGADHHDGACVLDIEELIEAQEDGPGVLVSHGVSPFLDDFSVVATFGLGAIFSRRSEVVHALTTGQGQGSRRASHHGFIKELYDETRYIPEEEAEAFKTFVEELLGLERRSFLGAMRAMRTFVSGLHRLADDPTLAYTLMVSSIESLAQDFDAYTPVWPDIDPRRRQEIDKALDAVEISAGDGVRAAILKHEHLALARRYRAFILDRVDANYFRPPLAKVAHPIARLELERALRQAYDFRSAHLHQLRELPDILTMSLGYCESVAVERQPALTFQGLYRLTRHVIQSFVAERPKVASEPYNYRMEEAGIVSLPLAAQYWVWKPVAEPAQVLRRLEGMLEITASQLNGEPDVLYPDMRSALADVERLLGQAPRSDRAAMLCLHMLYNLRIGSDYRTPGFDRFFEAHRVEANRPGPITITIGVVLHATDDWELEDHQNALTEYFRQSTRPKGLHAPRLVEAAMCLELAEKLRKNGKIKEAAAMIAQAVEAHPGSEPLRRLEVEFDPEQELACWKVLAPQTTAAPE